MRSTVHSPSEQLLFKHHQLRSKIIVSDDEELPTQHRASALRNSSERAVPGQPAGGGEQHILKGRFR